MAYFESKEIQDSEKYLADTHPDILLKLFGAGSITTLVTLYFPCVLTYKTNYNFDQAVTWCISLEIMWFVGGMITLLGKRSP